MFRRILGPFSRWIGAEPRRSERKTLRRTPRATPQLEKLEERVNPAVTATSAAGVLTITGDATNNLIAVAEDPAAQGSYKVFGDGVALNAGLAFTAITSITIDTKTDAGTADKVFLIGDLTKNGTAGTANGVLTALTGGISITGSGATGLIVDWGDFGATAGSGAAAANATGGFNVLGTAAVSLTGTGALTFTAGGGGTAQFGNTMGATTISDTSTGATVVTLQGSTSVTGGFTTTLGTNAANVVSVKQGSTISGNFVTSSTGTADVITIGGAVVADVGASVTGNVTITGTAANSGMTVNVLGATVGGVVSIASGTGADTININKDASVVTNPTEIGGVVNGGGTRDGVSLGLGGGTNTITFKDSSVDGNFLTNDGGNDVVNISASVATTANIGRVQGFVSLNNLAAASASAVTVTNENIGTFLSIVSGAVAGGIVSGGGTDTVTVTGCNVGTAANNQFFQNSGCDLGGGTNTQTWTGNQIVGTYFTDGNQGTDTIAAFSGNHLGADAQFKDALSATFTMTAATNNFVANSVTMTSGTGNDTLLFDQSAIGIGGLVINSGTGGGVTAGATDTITLTKLTVEGNATITTQNISAATVETVTFTGSVVNGNAAITGAAGTFTENVTEAGTKIMGTSTIAVGDGPAQTITGAAFVGGNETITAGNGGNTVNINNAVRNGSETITTGNAIDTINLENPGAVDSISSQFFGAVTITTQGGNDVITLGKAATDLALFFGAATIDGGAGAGDVLTDANAEYFGARTVTNIP